MDETSAAGSRTQAVIGRVRWDRAQPTDRNA